MHAGSVTAESPRSGMRVGGGEDTFREKIWHLPVGDLLGVGRSTQKALKEYGIQTIGDLARLDPMSLPRCLGKSGAALWAFANGQDHSAVHHKDFKSPVKSVGHGTTTMADLHNGEQVWMVMLELAQEIGHKLRVHQSVPEALLSTSEIVRSIPSNGR